MLKKSAIKLADDASFEQNFFQLAFAYIRDKVPNLLDYMLGFEVVNKNEEGTQAVGLFKFDISGRELYIPVFYKNGELKGADLLYNKNQDTFVPNKENWIDTILNARPEELGAPSEYGRADPSLSTGNPDLSKIYNSTQNTKLSVDKMTKLAASGWSFLSFLKQADCKVADKYSRTLMAYPELHKMAVEAYGEDIYAALSSCKQAVDEPETESVPDVEVITSDSPEVDLGFLSNKERKELIEDGVVLRDNRKDGARIPYKIQTPMVLTATAEAGIYEVIMLGGKFITAAVIPVKVCCEGLNKKIIIPLEGSEVPGVVLSADIMATHAKDGSTKFKSYLAGLAAATTAKGSNSQKNYEAERVHCVFIDSDGGKATGPLMLAPGVASGDTETFEVSGGAYTVRQVVVSSSYKWIQEVGDTLYVPATAKVVKFSAKPYCCKKLNLGTHMDVDARIKGSFDEVKVSRDRGGYKIANNGKVILTDLDRIPAIAGLVVKVGAAIEVAKAAIAQVSDYSSMTLVFKKQANPFFSPGQLSAPAFPDSETGMNSQLGVPEQYPQSESMSVSSGLPGNISNERIMDSLGGMGTGGPTLPQESVDAIMQSAQSGDKEVFDVSNISEMINKSDIDTPLDMYMSDLQLALDRLGRIYFLMLYHGDKFQERFSQEDLPAMESSLRNVFLSLGELILKLKERKIQSDSGSAVETNLDNII